MYRQQRTHTRQCERFVLSFNLSLTICWLFAFWLSKNRWPRAKHIWGLLFIPPILPLSHALSLYRKHYDIFDSISSESSICTRHSMNGWSCSEPRYTSMDVQLGIWSVTTKAWQMPPDNGRDRRMRFFFLLPAYTYPVNSWWQKGTAEERCISKQNIHMLRCKWYYATVVPYKWLRSSSHIRSFCILANRYIISKLYAAQRVDGIHLRLFSPNLNSIEYRLIVPNASN